MKVVFLKDAPGQGRKGEVKDVSEGFARHFLIPKGVAQLATPDIQAKIAKEAREAENKKLKEIEKLKNLKSEVEKRTFTLKVKVGDKGQVFGSVHEKEIAKVASDRLGTVIEKNQVEIVEAIKTLGEHQARIKLGNGLIANIKLHVEAQ